MYLFLTMTRGTVKVSAVSKQPGQVDEEKGDRKFGGCLSARLPVRDVSANMRVTAKQIRYKEAITR